MSENDFSLEDFWHIFLEIVRQKRLDMQSTEICIIDEDEKESSFWLADEDKFLEAEGDRFHLNGQSCMERQTVNFLFFNRLTVLELLVQYSDQLNFLTIYTKRSAYFQDFAEKMYEENGLIVNLLPKEKLEKRKCVKENPTIILDFETEGPDYHMLIRPGSYYIPIYKKTWQIAENLDITVPIGYNTVIVKSRHIQEQKPKRDRFEEAFYKKDERQSNLVCHRTNLMKKGRTKWTRKTF